MMRGNSERRKKRSSRDKKLGRKQVADQLSFFIFVELSLIKAEIKCNQCVYFFRARVKASFYCFSTSFSSHTHTDIYIYIYIKVLKKMLSKRLC